MKKGTILAAVLALASTARADGFVSKSYEFKANKPLQVGIELGDGAKFDSIEFVLPEPQGDKPTPLFEQPKAKVTVSNLGEASVKIGIALAVVDGEGNLVGAGTGGTKLIPLRAGRQMVYSIGFDDVRQHLSTASAFRITFETTH
ncbi:MAG TPA: hypothetical protein VF139_14335 [Candidatus Polarisedimenticolaceae bacterium]